MFRTEVSIGDVAVVIGALAQGLYFFFGTVRQIDRVAARVAEVDKRVEDLRRGRGLIMESWPTGFQRVMGFLNGWPKGE